MVCPNRQVWKGSDMEKEEMKSLLKKVKKQTLMEMVADLAENDDELSEKIIGWLQKHEAINQLDLLEEQMFEAVINQLKDILDELADSEDSPDYMMYMDEGPGSWAYDRQYEDVPNKVEQWIDEADELINKLQKSVKPEDIPWTGRKDAIYSLDDYRETMQSLYFEDLAGSLDELEDWLIVTDEEADEINE